MKKSLLNIIILSIFSTVALGQVRFDPGYFINNDGEKVTCLIKNLGWIDTPNSFTYLIDYQGDTFKKEINEIQEFGIGTDVVFKRFTVSIDRSSMESEILSNEASPQFRNETLLLRQLVSGGVNLYVYKKRDFERYFYQDESNLITQLIYKKYQSANGVSTNSEYQNQLATNLNCEKLTSSQLEEIEYNQNDLVSYFIKQNKCQKNSYFSPYEVPDDESKIQFNLRAGVTNNSLNVDYAPGRIFDADFGSALKSRIGIEVEFTIPFESKQWVIALEPSLESFEESRMLEFSTQTNLNEADVSYNAFNLSAIVRRYFRFSNKSRFFVNIGLMGGVPFNNSFLEIENTLEVDIRPAFRFNLGAGYSFNERIFLEVRQNSSIDFVDTPAYDARYKSAMITLGYRVFEIKR